LGRGRARVRRAAITAGTGIAARSGAITAITTLTAGSAGGFCGVGSIAGIARVRRCLRRTGAAIRAGIWRHRSVGSWGSYSARQIDIRHDFPPVNRTMASARLPQSSAARRNGVAQRNFCAKLGLPAHGSWPKVLKGSNERKGFEIKVFNYQCLISIFAPAAGLWAKMISGRRQLLRKPMNFLSQFEV
jgi:hypothetical protein